MKSNKVSIRFTDEQMTILENLKEKHGFKSISEVICTMLDNAGYSLGPGYSKTKMGWLSTERRLEILDAEMKKHPLYERSEPWTDEQKDRMYHLAMQIQAELFG